MNQPANNGRRARSARRPATTNNYRRNHIRRTGRTPFGERGRGTKRRSQPTFNPEQFINTNPVDVAEAIYEPTHSFHDFGLHPRLVETVLAAGITTPSPIQDQTIPPILQGSDVVGLAETGTGKTAAFLLPLIQKTLGKKDTVTLILTPTRELAIQVEAELRKLSQSFKIWGAVCVGGTNINPQIRALKRHNDFIIGTPGRIIDLKERGCLPLAKVNTIVLDEADRMLDMGFIHDMRKILGAVTADRQTLFFSATMTKEAENLVADFMRSPITISTRKKAVTNSIKQDVVWYEHAHKFDVLLDLLKKPELRRVMVFGAMKHSVEKLAIALTQSGVKAESIHGNKSHGQRQRSLTAFKKGEARVLVATDVAARGIHVEDVTHVINYDLPNTFEDYVHRIGRTGRGTKRGEALTFVSKE